ncbi:hypothetical protein F7734_44250 [Scytonema sp. UIC 10036]|uniref:hypothetical protein n=1 Tax=Scytonema sp. UIC 10036 TaxID=2304196 RepID=UPI0012DA052E|nr:hypothetical protein [Scytonema sp. UIC 10036]MUG98938.1 hypothetical protein [Scytonema sp. UIC 10036]
MAESPMLGARCPVEWAEKIKNIAHLTGRSEAEVVREAIGALSRDLCKIMQDGLESPILSSFQVFLKN